MPGDAPRPWCTLLLLMAFSGRLMLHPVQEQRGRGRGDCNARESGSVLLAGSQALQALEQRGVALSQQRPDCPHGVVLVFLLLRSLVRS